MQYRIEEKEAFSIVGFMKRVQILFEGENPEITNMQRNLSQNTIDKLKEISNTAPKGLLQASANFDEGRMDEKGALDHYIGVATNNYDGKEFSTLKVPASAWAVFGIEDSSTEKIQNTWGRIFSEWFPESDYELAQGPEILWNENGNQTSATSKNEIWIPVQKKQSFGNIFSGSIKYEFIRSLIEQAHCQMQREILGFLC